MINNKISSRYSIVEVDNNSYGKLVIYKDKDNIPSATLNSDGTLSSGYIFVPYTTVKLTEQEIKTIKRKMLIKERNEKLNRIYNIQ